MEFFYNGGGERTVLNQAIELGRRGHDVEVFAPIVKDDSFPELRKEVNLTETKGFIVYGYTAEDTYYACYTLIGGLLEWLQHVQDGVTTIVLRIDYDELHPVGFHVEE